MGWRKVPRQIEKEGNKGLLLRNLQKMGPKGKNTEGGNSVGEKIFDRIEKDPERRGYGGTWEEGRVKKRNRIVRL